MNFSVERSELACDHFGIEASPIQPAGLDESVSVLGIVDDANNSLAYRVHVQRVHQTSTFPRNFGHTRAV
ncbi:MAG: hypothetical protein ACTHOU_16155, partial [Aureliella sp.]